MSLSKRVKLLLETFEHCRDDDYSLLAEIWGQECLDNEYGISEIPASQFFGLMRLGKISKQQTILRIRRDLNNKFPHTRGKSYNRNRKK